MRYWGEFALTGLDKAKQEQVKRLVREQKRIYGALLRQAKKDNVPDFLVWNEIAMLPPIPWIKSFKNISPR